VVYRYVPEYDLELTIDLFGSGYDTKVFVYNGQLDVVACNDDYYDDYVSRITAVAVSGGAEYYIVIDGYSAQHGDYNIVVEQYEPCVVECPTGGFAEGEPPLVDGYVDAYNGGCVSYPELGYAPYQTLETALFCGVSGWYDSMNGSGRDTDWFIATVPAEGVVEIELISEIEMLMWHMSHVDCSDMEILQYDFYRPCVGGVMEVHGNPGDLVEIVLEPQEAGPPDYFLGNEFSYVLTTNLEPSVTIEARSWSSVKRLFDGQGEGE
jgi:hypothetical protein